MNVDNLGRQIIYFIYLSIKKIIDILYLLCPQCLHDHRATNANQQPLITMVNQPFSGRPAEGIGESSDHPISQTFPSHVAQHSTYEF